MPPASPQTLQVPPLSLRADVSSVNVEQRSVDVIFSTGAAVERMDWWTGKRYLEKLEISPSAIRLDRLNGGAPLLDAHSAWSVGDILGAVEPASARVEKGKAIATVRFSRRAAVEDIWQDVREGIVRNVSVGYRVHKFEEDAGKDNKLPIRTAVDWEPFEISMVPMPADTGARVRADRSDLNTCVLILRDTGSADDGDRMRRFRLARAQCD